MTDGANGGFNWVTGADALPMFGREDFGLSLRKWLQSELRIGNVGVFQMLLSKQQCPCQSLLNLSQTLKTSDEEK